jgi:hypothetical protein
MRQIFKDNPELVKRAEAGDPEARKQIAALLKPTAASRPTAARGNTTSNLPPSKRTPPPLRINRPK